MNLNKKIEECRENVENEHKRLHGKTKNTSQDTTATSYKNLKKDKKFSNAAVINTHVYMRFTTSKTKQRQKITGCTNLVTFLEVHEIL